MSVDISEKLTLCPFDETGERVCHKLETSYNLANETTITPLQIEGQHEDDASSHRVLKLMEGAISYCRQHPCDSCSPRQ
jgi:hypothetical protein